MGITYNELEEIKQIKHGLIKDLIEYGKKDGKLTEIDTLAHAIKNMCKIIEDGEMELEEGYSGARGMGNYSGYSYAPMPPYALAQGQGGGGNSGNYGYSNARRRDSMGRYSSHGDLRSELYSVMNMASNDMERQEIQNLINRLDQNH